MYEIRVEHEFCAAHALVIGGVTEPLHGHNWRVRASVSGPDLDPDGLLCDFHALERVLATVCDPFRDRYLNDVAPFDRENPSAEHVARHIALALTARLAGVLERGARVSWVSVTEATGCRATYRT